MQQIENQTNSNLFQDVMSRIAGTRIRLAFLLLLSLAGWGNAWGSVTITNDGEGACIGGNIVLSTEGDHTTFTFAPNSGSLSGVSPLNSNWELGYYYIKVGKNSNKQIALTWTEPTGASIKVTNVSFKVKLASGGRAEFSGTTENYNSGWFADNNYSMSASNANGLTSPMILTLTNTKNGRWDGDVEFQIDDISITYTIKPHAPGLSVTSKTINVTLNANNLTENEPQTVDLNSIFSTATNHLNTSRTYSITTNPNNGGVKSGSIFYATKAGEYKVKAQVESKSNCHDDSDWSEPLTITVNRLNSVTTFPDRESNVTVDGGSKEYTTLPATDDGRTITYTVTSVSGDWANSAEAHFDEGYKFYATAAGEYTVRATADANDRYNSIDDTFTITVKRVGQSLSWDNESDIDENLNIKVGKTYDIKVTATSGLNVTYTTSNSSSLTVNEGTSATTSTGSTLTGVATSGDGTIAITASQQGNKQYEPAVPLTKLFKVLDKQTPALYLSDSWTTANSKTSCLVGAQYTVRVDKVSNGLGTSNSNDFYYTVSPEGALRAEREGNIVTITAWEESSNATITFTQKDNDDIYGNDWSYTFGISKNKPTITVPEDQTLFVDGDCVVELSYTNTSKLVPDSGSLNNDFYYTITHELSSEVNKSEAVVTFNPSTGKIVAQNAGVATITITQKATREYSEKSNSFKVTVSKYSTTISGDATYNLQVEGTSTIGNYSTINTSADLPEEGNTHDFFYTIAHTPNAVTKGSDHPTKVIAYSPSTKTITAYNAGPATLTIAQKETYKYTGDTITFNVTVSKHQTSFSGSAYNLMVDGTQMANYSYTNTSAAQPTASSSDDFYYTIDDVTFTNEAKNKGTNLVTFNPSTKLITACNAGTAKITLHQKETYKYTGATASYNVAVYKYNSDFANVANLSVDVDADKSSAYTLTYTKPNDAYVGNANHSAGTPSANSEDDWYYTLAQNVTTDVTKGSDQPTWAIAYSAGTKTATGKNKGTGTVHLYQKETYKYNSADQAFTVTVSKLSDTLRCSWGNSWSKTLNFDGGAFVSFTSTYSSNTSLMAETPIVVTQTAGDNIATFYPASVTGDSKDAVYASCYIGEATWNVSQAENYKYNAATTKVLRVNVAKNEDGGCDIRSLDGEKEASRWGEITLPEIGTAGTLYFHMRYKGVGGYLKLTTYVNGEVDMNAEEYGIGLALYRDVSVQLKPNTTKIKFEGKGTDDPYVSGIHISRGQKWFKLENTGGVEISELPITKTLGNSTATAQFVVDYSTCAGEIKVKSNDPNITVDITSFTPETSHKKTITVTYTSDEVEERDAIITVYSEYENATLAIHAVTEKKTQEIRWRNGYNSNPLTLPVGLSTDTAAYATSGLAVTYTTNNAEVIRIYTTDEGKSAFEIIGKGTAKLAASHAGDDEYKPVSDTIDVNATDKQIQVILWDQDLTRLRTDADPNTLTLTAQVMLMNTITGDLTYSAARTALLTYGVGNSSVVSVDGSQLTINGAGSTTITASVAVSDDYEAASTTMPVVVREPSTGCEDENLTWTAAFEKYNGQDQGYEERGDYILHFSDVIHGATDYPALNVVFTIDQNSGVPGQLSFSYTGTKYAGVFYGGEIEVRLSNDGVNWGDVIWHEKPKVGERKYATVNLKRTTKYVKFTRPQGGTGFHHIGNVEITPAQYLEAGGVDFGNVEAGSVATHVATLNFSNLKGEAIEFTSDNSAIRVVSAINDIDCGSFGSRSFSIECAPMAAGTINANVTLRDPLSGLNATIAVTANVTTGSQTITWEPSRDEFTVIEQEELNAQLPKKTNKQQTISYASNNAEVVRIENGTAIIVNPGDVTITSLQAGDGVNFYAATPVEKTFTITKATPIVTWPTASAIQKGQALSNSTLTGGSAKNAKNNDVPGSFAWENGTEVMNTLGTQMRNVVFTPDNTDWYETVVETIEVEVKRAEYIFTGEAGEQWTEEDSWETGKVPSDEHVVIINADVLIEEEVKAYSVTIDADVHVTIAPTGGLTVGAGGIRGATKENLILQADKASESVTKGKTGFLRIDPACEAEMPEATVELFTIAYYNMEAKDRDNVGSWQYVGAPIVTTEKAKTFFTDSWIYSWEESTGGWINNRKRLVTQPFTGYATSQDLNPDGITITFTGTLVSNKEVEIPLTYTDTSAVPGCNVLANSFCAPIDVTKFGPSDFSEGIDPVIYLFNTGSKKDIASSNSARKGEGGNLDMRGQYIPMPTDKDLMIELKKANENHPAVIPSMQGFYINTTGKDGRTSETLKLNYERLVWDGDQTNVRLRAPRRNSERTNITGAMNIVLSSDGWSDQVYVFESEQYTGAYDRGKDARKMESGNLNIFAVEGEDKLAIDATNSIIGTRVGVRTGSETAYTMTFSHLRSENELALYDAETGQTVDIDEGTEYTFFAVPESEITERFMIIEREDTGNPIATGTESITTETKVQKFIKDNQLFILKNGVLYDATGKRVR